MLNRVSKICLATVTTKEFIPATLVMLHSFLKHNPWFKGEIVIIHDDLEIIYRQYLEICFNRVKFFPVSSQLKTHLKPLLLLRPDLLHLLARFYSLETFRLRGYDKVLFYDGDILFRASIQALFEKDEKLICCGEGLYYTNACRDRTSLDHLQNVESKKTDVLRNTFNGGFLLVDHLLLTDHHYNGLLEMLNIARWKKIKVRMTDQAVFNLYFAGQQTLVNCEYNYLLRYRSEIETKEGIGLDEAKVLHYCGPTKPWKADRVLSAAQNDPGMIKAMKFWQDDYVEVLQLLHFKSRVDHLKTDKMI